MSEFTEQIAKYHDETRYGNLFVGKSVHEVLHRLSDLHMVAELRILAENAKLVVRIEELTGKIGNRSKEETERILEKNKELDRLTAVIEGQREANRLLRQQLADSKGLTNAKAIN